MLERSDPGARPGTAASERLLVELVRSCGRRGDAQLPHSKFAEHTCTLCLAESIATAQKEQAKPSKAEVLLFSLSLSLSCPKGAVNCQ